MADAKLPWHVRFTTRDFSAKSWGGLCQKFTWRSPPSDSVMISLPGTMEPSSSECGGMLDDGLLYLVTMAELNL